MKPFRVLLLIAAVLAVVPAGFSQETKAPKRSPEQVDAASAPEGEAQPSDEGQLKGWKWANFVVLAGAIGYLIGRNAGPMFSERSRQIRKDMIEASEARKEAEARAATVDRRLANLEAEIAALREESAREAKAETQRLEQQRAAEAAKIQAHAEQEIAATAKAARLDLKRYSAQLAIELAERKIRDRMTPDAEDALVQGFVRNLQ